MGHRNSSNPNNTSGSSPGRTPCPQIGLRVPDAAELIGATNGYIEQQMRDGTLPYRMVGGTRVIAVEDLKAHFFSIPKQSGKRREPIAATEARRVAA
jgi:excisionase family DNA binding protein